MAQSAYTKSCRTKLWICRILDWICLGVPLIVYIIIALASGQIGVGYKIAVMSTLVIALILTIFNVIAQKRLRCPIWILLLGLYVAVKEWLLPLIVMLAITSILDDLVFTPLIDYYHTKLIASKVMDDREEAEKDGEQ